ncbi:hypothetical protein HMPREF1318_1201 [Actinomyces massiliensis F0489]|uniref:Lipoprotein n=1 Tax=Actinomyces massiliensis F0489 TaxID=1125718 RepID=J1HNI1_9ACTO|nr:hypothetical protein HMPREF1318_1201 [Actinomyces massiliensis F0489]
MPAARLRACLLTAGLAAACRARWCCRGSFRPASMVAPAPAVR